MKRRKEPARPLSTKNLDLSRKLDDIRSKAETLWQKGLINHPDFTLHGIPHSEFIIETLDGLIAYLDKILEKKGLEEKSLSDYERFILGSSAYLQAALHSHGL